MPAPFFLLVCVAVGPADVAGTVVVVKPTPPGPKLIVCPLYTSVVVAAPGPMVKVVPPISTNVDPIFVKVMPPAVITSVTGLNGEDKVVPPSIVNPPSPAVIVLPFTTAVVDVAPGPTINVVPSTTAM